MGGGAAAVALAVVTAVASRREGDRPGSIERLPKGQVWEHPALTGALRTFQLTGRNWRTPGMRATGIRHVDARTLGPVSFRSAAVALLLQMEAERISGALAQPANARAEARRLAANDEIERMRASRPDEDPKQLIIDSAEIRKRHGASTFTWMFPRMLTRTAVEQLPALWSRRRQTLTERLAGTVVLLDR